MKHYMDLLEYFKSHGYRMVKITTSNGTIYTLPLTDVWYFSATCYYDLTLKTPNRLTGHNKVCASLTNRRTINDLENENFAVLYEDAILDIILEANEKIFAFDKSIEREKMTLNTYFTKAKERVAKATNYDHFRFADKIPMAQVGEYENFLVFDQLLVDELNFVHSKNILTDIRQGNIFLNRLTNKVAKDIALSVSHIISIEAVEESRYFITDEKFVKTFEELAQTKQVNEFQ